MEDYKLKISNKFKNTLDLFDENLTDGQTITDKELIYQEDNDLESADSEEYFGEVSERTEAASLQNNNENIKYDEYGEPIIEKDEYDEDCDEKKINEDDIYEFERMVAELFEKIKMAPSYYGPDNTDSETVEFIVCYNDSFFKISTKWDDGSLVSVTKENLSDFDTIDYVSDNFSYIKIEGNIITYTKFGDGEIYTV